MILKGVTYVHPIYKNKICSFLPASHVVDSKGTGLVHTAPAHGPDDYLVALENNINIVSFFSFYRLRHVCQLSAFIFS